MFHVPYTYYGCLVWLFTQNPLEKSDIVDSSGIRMYHTPTPRQYEVGTLQVGLDINVLGQWIPGGLEYAHSAAFLPKECTEEGFPEEGINVFGSFLHQHTIGRALNWRHIRDGVEQKPIDTNLDYELSYCIYHTHI